MSELISDIKLESDYNFKGTSLYYNKYDNYDKPILDKDTNNNNLIEKLKKKDLYAVSLSNVYLIYKFYYLEYMNQINNWDNQISNLENNKNKITVLNKKKLEIKNLINQYNENINKANKDLE